MEGKDVILKVIRDEVTKEDIDNFSWSKDYVYSILIGRREKLDVLLKCSEIAISNMYEKIALLQNFKLELEGNEIVKFAKMSFQQQMVILSKMKTAKEINEFKKELNSYGLLDLLNEDIKPYFNNLTKKRIEEIRNVVKLSVYLEKNERK
jgi:hypothetical protein